VKISIKDQLVKKGLVFKTADARNEESASQDSGLEFVAENRKIDKSKDEEEKPKVMQVSGRIVHQERTGVSLATRNDFFKSLKDKKMSKFQINDLEDLKKTFQTTDLNQARQKKS